MLFALGKQLAKLTSDKILPARIGGEEFAIIVDGMSAEEVRNLAQSILENVRSILINHDYPLSVSIGVGMREKMKRRMRLLRRWMKRSTRLNITAADASSGRILRPLPLLRAATMAAIFGRRTFGIAFKHPAKIVAVDKTAVVGNLFDF